MLVLIVGLSLGCSRQPTEVIPDTTAKQEQALEKDADYQEFKSAADEQKFEPAYERAVLLKVRFSDNAAAWNCLGFAADRLGKWGEAYSAYQKATILDSKYAKGWFNLGVIAGKLKKRKEEIKCYETAVELRPDYYKAWANLFSAYTESGQSQKAIKAYQRVRQLFPSFEHELKQDSDKQLGSVDADNEALRFDQRVSLPRKASGQLQWNDPAMAQAAIVQQTSTGLSIVPPPHPKGSTTSERKRMEEEMARVLNNRGMMAEENELWDESIMYYRLAARKLPKEPMVWNNLGMAQLGSGKYEDAVASFEEASKYSNDVGITLNLAIAHAAFGAQLAARGSDLGALDHFHRALALQPNMVEPRAGLISILRKWQKWDEVQSQCETLLQSGQDSADLWYTLALAHKALKNQTKTIEALEHAIRLNPDSADQWMWYGVEEAQAQKFDKAAEALEQAVKLDPNNIEAWYDTGLAQARLGNWDRAIFALRKASSMEEKTAYRQALAAVYEASGNSSEAITQYDALLKENPANAEIWKALADSYASNKQMKNAIEAYRKSISLKEDPQAWSGLGYALQENGKFRESCDAYQKAVDLGDNSPDVWNNLGVAHARLKEYPEALDAFTKAAKDRSKDSELLFNIGMVFHHMGKQSEVLRTYRTLQKIDAERARELQTMLQTMN